MFDKLNIDDYLKSDSFVPLIDVRSPGEYSKGHIPGAVNIPLFTDEERAKIGTVYKQQSKEKAIELGYSLVNPKLEYFIEASQSVATKEGIAVHCWRGGMRSHAFAEHLVKNGVEKVILINKGYKAFRNVVLDEFEKEYSLRIIGGFTGSGKTEILRILKRNGHQVIDLEGIAHHKGSAFGGIGQLVQPSVEQFENNLFWQWKDLDKKKEIWIEDESRGIGNVLIPATLFKKMREQTVYFLDIPRIVRAQHLVEGYANCDNNELAKSIERISKKLGGADTQLALEHLKNENYSEVAELALRYYDKYYEKGVNNRDPKMVKRIVLDTTDHELNAQLIKKYIDAN